MKVRITSSSLKYPISTSSPAKSLADAKKQAALEEQRGAVVTIRRGRKVIYRSPRRQPAA